MLNNIGSGGINVLAQPQTKDSANRKAATPTAEDKDSDAAKAAAEKRQRLQQTMTMLDQAIESSRQSRKAAAAEKVERLKRELEMLQRFGGDPKAVARQLARIAKELSSAVAAYSASSGGSTVASAAPVAPVSTEGAGAGEAARPAAETAVAAAQAAQSGEGDDAGPGGENAPESDVQTSDVQTSDVQTSGVQTAEAAPGAEKTAEQNGQAVLAAVNEAIGESQQRSAESRADAKFASDVRNLVNQIKALMEQQRRRAAEEGKDDSELKRLGDDVVQAGQSIEGSLSQISADSPIQIPVIAALPMPVNISI